MKNILKLLVIFYLVFLPNILFAWEGMPMPRLHIDGKYLKDSHGNIVNLHGFAQTYSPWFNEQGKYWNNYDVAGCLAYNQGNIDKIMEAGWKMSFLRLHMDPYWSNTPGCSGRYEGEECFNEERFRKYLDEVFIPMAEYAVSKGIYVIMRPPGVCPEEIAVGDVYNEYLIKVWTIVAQHPKLQNHPNIMFELANEPINILGPLGDYGASTQGHFDNLKIYFQSIVDAMRAQGCHNILWVPGLGYQGLYSGYAVNPIEGENIGYAVHIYPGWLGSDGYNEDGGQGTGGGYESFKAGWDKNVQPVADFAPVVITEMDWAEKKYDASWGKGWTGTAGGSGFGANMKKITDDAGNVSWLIFTEPYRLAAFTGEPASAGEEYTFLNDPEACPWPTYRWYQEYTETNYTRPEFTKLSHSDNGDGTYTNPVIHAEFPDPDVIRVGNIYYMVTTTMHIFPGATLLKSYDLVNWEFCSNPLEMIEASDCYNMDPNCDREEGKFRYARGQWATSIRYKDGKFYLLFTTLDEGGYLLTATDPEGSWEMKKLSQGYYDPGLFFDDDGTVYIVHGINNINMTQLNDNFEPVKTQQVYQWAIKEGLEGCHLYKINEYYYIYATYGGFPAYQTALRSNSIWGPYEEKLLLDDDNIHQGALIETQTGEWWTIMFYDKMPYGRMPNLQPITWVDGWPEIGVKENGVSKAVKTYTKPNVGAVYPITSLATNDNFRDYKLGLQWGWNHNPDHSKFSLLERPGFLRLRTANIVDEIDEARNTLTQRFFGYQSDNIPSYATIKMHISNMEEGDIAGLTAFTKPDTYIGVKVENGVKRLFVKTDDNITSGETVSDTVVYLRIITQFKYNSTNKGRFYYSFDNINYTPLASEFELKYTYDFFVAPRYGIFNFATRSLGGYVDIDWFTTEEVFTEDIFYDDSFIGYSEDALTPVSLNTDVNNPEMLLGTNKTVKIIALFADGHTEDVTTRVEITNSNPEAIRFVNGQLIALQDGISDITAVFRGLLGHQVSLQFQASSKIFPLTNELFNPKIFGEGTFDETTRTLITSQYGAGGWWYDNGIDISLYDNLTLELEQVQTCGASFRIYDESSYWTDCAAYDVGNNTKLIVDLHSMKKDNSGAKCDPSHVYGVCFWSFGGSPIKIKSVYLSGYNEPSNMDNIIVDIESMFVDVYTIMGIKVRTNVLRTEAVKDLSPGIYIVGKKKVLVLK